MSLEDWLKNGWLIEHKSSKQEISDLLSIARRDLLDCQSKEISDDWRFNIAYNAALQSAKAALAASGYRASREAHHYRVIQSLVFTIGAAPNLVQQLERFRKKRNIVEYDRTGTISSQEVDEIASLAKELAVRVKEWLRNSHSDFFPELDPI